MKNYTWTLLIGLFITFNVYSESEIIEDAKAAEQYLQSDAFQQQRFVDLDLQILAYHAEALNLVLVTYQLDLEAEVHFRELYFSAIEALNTARKLHGQAIDNAQVRLALAAIDLLPTKYPNNRTWINLVYDAGRLAMHLVEDPRLAFKYWHICAEKAHAGCMNILANNYFAGGYGLRQDLKESLYWHRKTFETGIRYFCAGVYSAQEIQHMLYLFPELDESQKWQQWQTQISQTYQDLFEREEKKGKQENWCRRGQSELNQYILTMRQDEPDQNLLKQAHKFLSLSEQAKEYEPAYFVSLSLIGKNNFLDDALASQDRIENEESLCDVAFYNILYANVRGYDELAESLIDNLSGHDAVTCEKPRVTVELLRNTGRW